MTELDELQDRWEAAVEAELPSAIGLRHRVHADPRASGDEEDTARVVVEALGVDDGVRVAKTGRAVLLPGTRPGPAVALRTELDALPVTERTGVPWASETPLMHACGHDVHMAALVATVRAAAVVGVPRPLLALLQPREETSPSGALDIVESGVLTEYGVESVIGAHVQPRLAEGVVSAVPGPVNASTDEFEVVVRGQGGHAGYPHLLRDPILALSQIVVSLQQLASRRVDPVFGAVCSVGRIEAGTTANVVPNEARLSGSLRLMRAEDRDLALEGLAEVVHGTAKAHGCRAELEISPCEPVLHNDAGLTQRAHRRLVRTGAAVDTDFRSFGADDFAHYCGMTRGLMMFVGLGDTAGAPSLHDELFLPPDAAIGQVASALIAGYLAAVEG
ncbi:N-acyl-L-amino acid amidohydrolase [Amycolatopsis sp. MJM2582]|uniref:M20 metallopeptidase family protein n=1 Tax=Amycolatopsis sp. MJM2582 TaxID=1427749 RepID=UPI00050819E7|nr:M20 family metallopeptidase [Amycolatopsis sp. MJM2582]KFZ77845.1 N-acyl-L-amino acid amidohydrolase [Amycolatopsis sp. MJM2582]